jgi:hypothetical protein
MLNHAFIQDDFSPDIPFRTLPTISEAVLQTMLPEKEGKIYFANLYEGMFVTYFHFVLITIFRILCILNLLLYIHSRGW